MLSRVIDDYYDAYAKEDRARMLAFYADEALFEDPTANLRAVGKAELTKLYDSIGWDDYADLSWNFEGRIFATDRVALEGTVSGLYRSKPFRMRIATIFIFKKGKIVHHLDLVDYIAFREQMKKG